MCIRDSYQSFDDILRLIRKNRDIRLLVEVEGGVRLVRYTPGHVEFEPTPKAPADLAQRLSKALHQWTGVRWAVSVVSEGGGATVAEARDATRQGLIGEAMAHPMVKAALDAFPGARIEDVKTPDAFEAEPAPEDDDEWDPFEEDE